MIFVCVSTGHFDPLIQACDALSAKENFLGQIGMGYFEPRFPFFRTGPPEKIEQHMADAELVITHGGTGMLSTLYRLKKRAVIIPKQIRYGEANDSQVELAVKWGELKMGTLCMDVANLEQAIQTCRIVTPEFPIFAPLGGKLRESLLGAELFVEINRA